MSASENNSELVRKIKAGDENVRAAAWQSAEQHGVGAVRPLAGLLNDPDLEVARAAKRGLWRITRHVGRTGADEERRAVVTELLSLLQGLDPIVAHEVLWMLSELGGAEVVPAVSPLLSNARLRQDALAALERIPGEEAVNALQNALASAPGEFRPAIAHSLRVRGVKVEGYPSQKMVPTRPGSASPKAL